MELLNSLVEFFSTLDVDALIADLSMIVENIDFDLIVETVNSLVATIQALFA